MKLRTSHFFIREGLRSLKRNRTMSATSITSVIAALLVIGIFYLIMLNIDYAATKLESQIEMRVYLAEGLSENIINSISGEVEAVDGVKDVVFVSKTEALQQLQKEWGDNAYVLEGLDGENPLPDTLVVTLDNPVMASSVALAVSSISNIENVIYGKEELAKLLQATYIVRMSSLVIILILLFISVFIISNTIKLTVYARRREIGIMKFVGATDWFVRGPFIVEGIILGILGGLIATLLLGTGYYYCAGLIKQQMIGFMTVSLMPFSEIIISLTGLLTLVGIVIGTAGSLISVRRFIKV